MLILETGLNDSLEVGGSLHCVSSSLLGPVDPSDRALSGRPKFTVQRHKFEKDSLSAEYNVFS